MKNSIALTLTASLFAASESSAAEAEVLFDFFGLSTVSADEQAFFASTIEDAINAELDAGSMEMDWTGEGNRFLAVYDIPGSDCSDFEAQLDTARMAYGEIATVELLSCDGESAGGDSGDDGDDDEASIPQWAIDGFGADNVSASDTDGFVYHIGLDTHLNADLAPWVWSTAHGWIYFHDSPDPSLLAFRLMSHDPSQVYLAYEDDLPWAWSFHEQRFVNMRAAEYQR